MDEGQLYLRQRFIDFLDSPLLGNYHKVIEKLVEGNERRLAIDLNALRQFSADLATGYEFPGYPATFHTRMPATITFPGYFQTRATTWQLWSMQLRR